MPTPELKATIDNVRLVAYHESGHAVAALHFGLRVAEVTIIPNEAFSQRGCATRGASHQADKQ